MTDIQSPEPDGFWQTFRKERREEPIRFFTMLIALSSFAITVIGLGFVFFQFVNVRQQITALHESLDLQSYSAINSQVSEIDKVFIDKPELRPYFYQNQAWPKDAATQGQLTSVAERKLDLFDFWFMSARHMDRKQYDMVSWKNYFVSSFRNSRVLCDVLRTEQGQYQDELRAIASQSGCANIAPRNPEVLVELEKYFPARTSFGP
jgi:hypothetical protein